MPSVLPVPEAAGPRPGQPGHFAHHDWLTAAVKALDTQQQKALPNAVSVQSAGGGAIVAAAFAPMPTPLSVPITLTAPIFAQLIYSAWLACSGTGGGDIRASVEITGATAISSSPPVSGAVVGDGTDWNWGDTLYATNVVAASNQQTGVRYVKLNAGTSTFALWATKSGTGALSVNYCSIRVIPIRYV